MLNNILYESYFLRVKRSKMSSINTILELRRLIQNLDY